MNYHKARPNFHQWRDAKQHVYGLSFASLDEAEAFAAAVDAALEQLAALKRQQSGQPQQPQPEPQIKQAQPTQQHYQQPIGNGTINVNHIPQQQQQPHQLQQQMSQPQMQYRDQPQFEQPSYAESNRMRRVRLAFTIFKV